MSLMDELNALLAEAKEIKAKTKAEVETPAGRIAGPAWEPKTLVLVTRDYHCQCGLIVNLPAMYGVRWTHPKYGSQLHVHNRPPNYMALPRERLHLEPIQVHACVECWTDVNGPLPSMPYIESEFPRAGAKEVPEKTSQPNAVSEILGDLT